MKTSGAESVYSDFFYSTPTGQRSNNCYGYAIDHYHESTEPYKLQPGELSGDLRDTDLRDCRDVTRKMLKDNPQMYRVPHDAPCRLGFYKIYLFVAPGRDYHFYTQNRDVLLRLKKGDTPASLSKKFGVPATNVILPYKGTIALIKDARVWSHKRGNATGALLEDACKRIITDPRKACRSYDGYNYSMDCGTFCTPNHMYQYGRTPTKTTRTKTPQNSRKSASGRTRTPRRRA